MFCLAFYNQASKTFPNNQRVKRWYITVREKLSTISDNTYSSQEAIYMHHAFPKLQAKTLKKPQFVKIV